MTYLLNGVNILTERAEQAIDEEEVKKDFEQNNRKMNRRLEGVQFLI